jgi:hypothetical protein
LTGFTAREIRPDISDRLVAVQIDSLIR